MSQLTLANSCSNWLIPLRICSAGLDKQNLTLLFNFVVDFDIFSLYGLLICIFMTKL